MIKVFPVHGRLIRDPFTRAPVPLAGVEVDATDPFWARALAAGDVAAEHPAPAPAPASDTAE